MEADRDYLVGVTMADVGDVAIQGSDTEGNYEPARAGVLREEVDALRELGDGGPPAST